MKIRSGFVSNSSSSSFIVGVAEVIDEAALDAYVSKFNLGKNSELKIRTIGEIKENIDYGVNFENGKIIVSSFCTDITLDVSNKPDSTKIIYTNIINDEGDSSFDVDGDIDYDIDLDFFDESQQDIYRLFNTPDVGCNYNTSQVDFGAARNG
jgi:hypothetical protein